jgi:hypothetical protein
MNRYTSFILKKLQNVFRCHVCTSIFEDRKKVLFSVYNSFFVCIFMLLAGLILIETVLSQIYHACLMHSYLFSAFAHLYVLQLEDLALGCIIDSFRQASSRSNSVEASKFAAHTQAIFAADVCHVIKAASLLLSGATERAIPFERIILLEQFVTEAAEIWSVPNSRLFALPYSLSRTCRLSLTVSVPVSHCCLHLLLLLTRDQGQSDDANFDVEDAN